MHAPQESSLSASLRLLLSRSFGPFLLCSLLSNIGTWMQMVAEPWLLLNLSGSSFLVGLDSFMMNGPILFLIVIGGILADRHDRRRVILLFQSIQMLCPVLVVALLYLQILSPWMIIALSLVIGITDALSMPSYQSMVPLIVDKKDIGRAITLNAANFNLSRVIGPALGGITMATIGAAGCFGMSALSYLPFIAAAYLVLPAPVPGAAATAQDTADLHPIKSLLGPVMRQPEMRGAVFVILVMSVFCGPLMTFTSVLVKSVLHSEATAFGNSMAAFGLGGVIGAAVLLTYFDGADERRVCTGAGILYGACLMLASIVKNAALLAPLMLLAGASMAAGSAAANSLLQRASSRERLGRSTSVFMLAMRGGLALGNLAAGFVVSRWGIEIFLACSGGIAIVLQAANFRFWKTGNDPAPAAG